MHYYYEPRQGVLFDWTSEIEQEVQESEVGACQALLFPINTNFSKLQCGEEPHDSKSKGVRLLDYNDRGLYPSIPSKFGDTMSRTWYKPEELWSTEDEIENLGEEEKQEGLAKVP